MGLRVPPRAWGYNRDIASDPEPIPTSPLHQSQPNALNFMHLGRIVYTQFALGELP